MNLPYPDVEISEEHDEADVNKEESQRIWESCSRLPFDYYRTTLNPFDWEKEGTGAGQLSDDIRSLYDDIAPNLTDYKKGNRAVAMWYWHHNFNSHWGHHAAEAIKALHEWLWCR